MAYDRDVLADQLARGLLVKGILAGFDTNATRVGEVNGPVFV